MHLDLLMLVLSGHVRSSFILSAAISRAGVSLPICLSPSDAATTIKSFGSAVSPSLTINLTPNRIRGAGAALMKLSYPTDSPSCAYFGFTSSFSFYIFPGDGRVGQGFTFAVVLNSSLGTGGSQLGYGGGTGPGFAVEFDTYSDPWDPPYTHMGINVGRTVISTVTEPATFLWSYNYETDGMRFVWVDLDPVSHTLSVFVSMSNSKPVIAILSTVIDLCKVLGLPSNSTLPPLYAGFTSSASDAAYGTQAVFDWSITTCEWTLQSGIFSHLFRDAVSFKHMHSQLPLFPL